MSLQRTVRTRTSERINEFKGGYQPRNNLMKDEDSHNILHWWKKNSQLLNAHNVSDVRQIEVHGAEPLVPGPSRLEAEIAIAKLKKYKSPGSDEIPAELIQAGGKNVNVCNSRTHSVWNKEEFPDQWKGYVIIPVHRKVDKTDSNNYPGISLLSSSYKILSNMLSRLSRYIVEIIGIISVGFGITDQLLIRFSTSTDTVEKMGAQRDSTSDIHTLQESLGSMRREIFYGTPA
jgi:hypothetical protein